MNSCNVELDDSAEDARNENGKRVSYVLSYRLKLE